MDLTEVTEKQRPSREQAAGRLHALAGALARHNGVEFERGGLPFTVHVPDETDLTLEIEIGQDERELEVELRGDQGHVRLIRGSSARPSKPHLTDVNTRLAISSPRSRTAWCPKRDAWELLGDLRTRPTREQM